MDMREKLLKRRKQLLDEANGLLETCEQAKRGMTDNEKAKHDRLIAQVKEINASLEANAAAEREAAVTVPISQTTAMAVATGRMPAETPGGAGASTAAGGAFALGSYLASQGRETYAGGGILVPEHLVGLWPSLLPASVAITAGVRVLSVRDHATIPSVSAHPQAAWIGEDSTIPPTSTGLKGTQVWFRKLASLQVVENDLIRSADAEVTSLLLAEQTRSLALQLDHAIFEADGTEHAILGLRSREDIITTALGDNGAELADLDPLINVLSMLESNNASPSGWVMHPLVWQDLMKLRDETDSLRPLLGENFGTSATGGISRRLLGLPVHLTSQLSIDEVEGSSGDVCRSIYCAQWDQVVLARDAAQQVYLDIDAGEKFSKDQTLVRALLRVDLVVPNPRAVYRLRGIKPTS